MARRSAMNRQPTTCGSSPWQHVDKPLAWRGVARSGRLADLIHVGQEGKHGLSVVALIDERFAAAQRSTGGIEEAENERTGLSCVHLSIGLLLGPSRAGQRTAIARRDGWFVRRAPVCGSP